LDCSDAFPNIRWWWKYATQAGLRKVLDLLGGLGIGICNIDQPVCGSCLRDSTSLVAYAAGIGAAADDLKSLDHAWAGFKVLFTLAAAVHAGKGASSDVVFCVGKDVAHFFELLAASPIDVRII
jgi:hypothetical protein